MVNDIQTQKETLRAEAKRARSLLSLDASEYQALTRNFFDNIDISNNAVIAAYWPKGRELDTQIIIDECLDRGANVSLPVIEKDSRVLKFARYTHNAEMIEGDYKICHPVINENTEWLEPDTFLVPLLAFDRKGNRLGYGGGYYDTTLAHYKNQQEITAVGLGFAKQACLFNLPSEEHDIKMNWIITEKGAQSFI